MKVFILKELSILDSGEVYYHAEPYATLEKAFEAKKKSISTELHQIRCRDPYLDDLKEYEGNIEEIQPLVPNEFRDDHDNLFEFSIEECEMETPKETTLAGLYPGVVEDVIAIAENIYTPHGEAMRIIKDNMEDIVSKILDFDNSSYNEEITIIIRNTLDKYDEY